MTKFANTLQRDIPCVPLSSLGATMTVFINDVAPAQLAYAIGGKNDGLIGLSTSGNSANVVNALKVAKAMGMKTIAMTGNRASSTVLKLQILQFLHLHLKHILFRNFIFRFITIFVLSLKEEYSDYLCSFGDFAVSKISNF